MSHTALLSLLDDPWILVSGNEKEFLQHVSSKIEKFISRDNPEGVLFFPPLDARSRFLIHKYVDGLEGYCTVSVGEEGSRRLAIYPTSSPVPAKYYRTDTNKRRPVNCDRISDFERHCFGRGEHTMYADMADSAAGKERSERKESRKSAEK